MITITRRLEFDAGHRIPDHASKCRNLHGHRYVLELTLQGEPVHAPGEPRHGMLVDFADVKRIAEASIVGPWDHAFLVYREDRAVAGFLAGLPWHKSVVLDCVPTVENLARIAFETLACEYRRRFGEALRLARVRLQETPNCWAECDAPGTGAVAELAHTSVAAAG